MKQKIFAHHSDKNVAVDNYLSIYLYISISTSMYTCIYICSYIYIYIATPIYRVNPRRIYILKRNIIVHHSD